MEITKKIYVDGIREDVTEDDLRNYFVRFGPVTEVTIIRDPTEVISYGFVTFEIYASANKVTGKYIHWSYL